MAEGAINIYLDNGFLIRGNNGVEIGEIGSFVFDHLYRYRPTHFGSGELDDLIRERFGFIQSSPIESLVLLLENSGLGGLLHQHKPFGEQSTSVYYGLNSRVSIYS